MFLSGEIRQTKFGTSVAGQTTSQITSEDYRSMLLVCGVTYININGSSARGALLKEQIM
jgi:hypothetical protein